MLVLLKLSPRRYMAIDTGGDTAYLGAGTYIGTPPGTGINCATTPTIVAIGPYADVLDQLLRHAKATGQIIAYADSKAEAIAGRSTGKVNAHDVDERD